MITWFVIVSLFVFGKAVGRRNDIFIFNTQSNKVVNHDFHQLKISNVARNYQPVKVADALHSPIEELHSASFVKVIAVKGSQKPVYFCRIKDVCRVGQGTFLLPQWMNQHSSLIANCGLGNIEYAILRENGTRVLDDKVTISKSTMTFTNEFENYTLLSSAIPSIELEALAKYVSLIASSLGAFSNSSRSTDSVREKCITENGQTCSDPHTSLIAAKPILLIDASVGEIESNKWQKCLLRLLRNTFKGDFTFLQLKDLYGWRIRSKAACFQSLVSTNADVEDISGTDFLPTEDFFRNNNLRRISNQLGQGEHSSCGLRILIRNQYGKRFLVGSESLQKIIDHLGKEVRSKKQNFQLRSEVVFFDHASFHEQVSVTQEADIIIAPHGDMNANFMFLRPNTAVFEITPFGTNNSQYRGLATLYGSRYTNIESQPDEEVFSACVKHFNSEVGEEVNSFLSSWTIAAEKFRNATKGKMKNVASIYVLPEQPDVSNGEENVVKKLHECATYQRTSVDVWDLAKQVVRAAVAQCGITETFSFLE